MFKLAQVLHCSTNQDFKIEDNMYCLSDNRPGPLLGLMKVVFFTIPRISDEYKNDIFIDVGLSKCLSVPIHLRVLTPNLYKLLGKYSHSGNLLLATESVFHSSKLKTKERFPGLENNLLTKRYSEQLKQAKLYSNNCAALLESMDEMVYYEKLCMLLYIEGDHRRRLIQRYVV